MTPAAFFSYSRDDSEFTLRLAEDLKSAGALVWLDQRDVRPGERWDRAVEAALTGCEHMLLILSPSSVSSVNVMDEVSFALEENKVIIPVLYRDCTIPFRLRRVQYIDFRGDYARALRELLKALAPKDRRPLPQEQSPGAAPKQAQALTQTVDEKPREERRGDHAVDKPVGRAMLPREQSPAAVPKLAPVLAQTVDEKHREEGRGDRAADKPVGRVVLQLLLHWVISATVLLIASAIIPGFQVSTLWSALTAAIILGLLNAVLGFFFQKKTGLRFGMFTQGAIFFAFNALVLKLASGVVPGFYVRTFGASIIGAIALAFIQTSFALFTGDESRAIA